MLRPRSAALALAVVLTLLPSAPAMAEEAPATPEPTATATVEPTAEPTSEPTDAEPTPEPTESEPTPTPTPTTPTPEPTDPEPTPEPEPETGVFEVDNAQLRWGINVESNARAFAPGTVNLLSAGKVGNPGQGGQTLTTASSGQRWANGKTAGWSAKSGDVTLEKSNGSAYARATWAGTSTDTSGASLGPAGGGTHSGHQLVFGKGTGEVDTEEGTATVRWDGDATVLYYSGMSFFYVSDPVLTVADGKGTVKATLSGYASSMEDMTKWTAVSPRQVTIATLPKVTIAAGGKGFTVTPAYEGVRLSSTPEQITNVSGWGAFPQSFVDFQKVAGAASYWFSSGGSADRLKAASPLTVSYDQGDPVTVKPPTSETDDRAEEVTNTTVAPPSIVTPTTPSAVPYVPTAAGVPLAAQSTPVSSAQDVAFVQAADGLTTTADQIAAEAAQALWWWLGIALLTLAAGSVAGTFAYSAAAKRP